MLGVWPHGHPSNKGVGMGTKYRTSDPRMFTVPAHDNVRDTELQLQVSIHQKLQPTAQRGVWAFTSYVHDNHRPLGLAPVITLQESWPNSHSESFEAFLFQHTNKVMRQAGDWRTDEERSKAKRTR